MNFMLNIDINLSEYIYVNLIYSQKMKKNILQFNLDIY